MSKPKTIEEAIERAKTFGTPTYLMLVAEIERLREVVANRGSMQFADLAQMGEQSPRKR